MMDWCKCEGHRGKDFSKLTAFYSHYFIPTGWSFDYAALTAPQEGRILYITGHCSQCGGFMRSGVSIYSRCTHDNLLEEVCREMLQYRPYAGQDESGLYRGGIPQRLEWYWRQDQMTKEERIEQFAALFRGTDQLVARRWAKDHMPALSVRQETSTEFFNAVVEQVQANGLWPEQSAFITCEPACASWPPDTVLSDHEFDFHPVLEMEPDGVRIDCCLRGRFDRSGRKHLLLGRIKTTCTDRDTVLTMGALTGALLYYGEAWRNDHIVRYLPRHGDGKQII